MMDVQFISELFLVLLEGKPLGFDQDALDEMYGKYEDITETCPELDEDEFVERLERVKSFLLHMEEANRVVTRHAKGFGNFYSLWALVALTPRLPAPADLANRYLLFMECVAELAAQDDLQGFLQSHTGQDYARAFTYLDNSRGASTDLAQRVARLEALRTAVVG